MKTILYSGLTANGNYGSSEAGQLPKQEEIDDINLKAKQAGNIIIGRKSYEIFKDSPIFKGIDVVVISSTSNFSGVKVAPSPREALDYLSSSGYDNAFIIGGVTLANTFLSQRLIKEMYINIEPYIENGLKLEPFDNKLMNLEFLSNKEIGNSGIVQIHYNLI